MNKDELTPFNARPESTVFAELAELCQSPGYAHAIAYSCWRDNIIRFDGERLKPGDVEHMHSGERLVRTEISTLIGLMVRQPISWGIPAPATLQGYIDHTEFLLLELHHALTKPWLDAWDPRSGKLPDRDPFSNAVSLREPIFYSGESAYNFQYVDLARLKYGGDDAWLRAHKGFSIEEACQVCEAVGALQNKLQVDCANILPTLPPDQWTMLPGFIFDHQQVAHVAGVSVEIARRVLEAFCLAPDDRNPAFSNLSAFNAVNACPLLKLDDDRYVLFQHYSLAEALYESPFFWMGADKRYAATALANRGRFTEGFAADRLATVFGQGRVVRNVDIYRGKDRVAEADALVLYGDRAIILQAKSKRLTIEARKGHDQQLKDDFKKAVQDACDQAHACAEALTGDGFSFRQASSGSV